MKTSKSVLLFFTSISLAIGKDKLHNTSQKPNKGTIVNGAIINAPSVIPYQVLFKGGNDGGGTIIAKKWILTAAHIATTGSSLQVYAGAINRNNLASGQNRVFKQAKLHPSYNGGQVPTNDIALIEVTQPFTFNGNVEAVKLASSNNSALWNIGQLPIVSGFGRTSAGGSLSNELRQVNVQVTNVDNTNNKIRAGGNSGNDSCQGDSGGPLSSNNTQIGVVSAGGTCGTCGTGGDYMMVSKYLNFITQTIHLFGTPDFVCGSTIFENISKLPDGVSFSWSASPANLFTIPIIPANQLSMTIEPNTNINTGPTSGVGTITLTVVTPAGTFIHSKNVWVGKPNAITLTTDGTFSINNNSTSICKSFGYCMTPSSNFTQNFTSNSPTLNQNNFNLSTASTFTYSGWPTSNSFCNICTTTSSPNTAVCFGTNNVGSNYFTVYANNSCGTNSRSIIVQVNSCGFRVSPNPAQSLLSIEFENPEMIESIPDILEIQDEKTQKVVKTKDLRIIKEKEKNNSKAYSKIDFDVSDLPRGTYYVQVIFNEKSQKSKESIRIILTD